MAIGEDIREGSLVWYACLGFDGDEDLEVPAPFDSVAAPVGAANGTKN